MCSASHSFLLALAVLISSAQLAGARELRVCADPNNLPFSNERLEGFENKIVDLVARDLGAQPRYTWWAQRRGFIRNTLNAKNCDLIPGTAAGLDMVRTTKPYYRSTYVFVTRPELPEIASLDDPALRNLKIGVHLIGDDGFNVPPAHALARRGIVANVRGFSIYGDYREDSPPARLIEAVGKGEIDVAIAWGPLAGYFGALQDPPLRITAVRPDRDSTLPMTFAVSMGVRRADEAFQREIEAVLARERPTIDLILASFNVPRAETATTSSGRAP
jgi:mxaJ protein